MSSKLPLPNPNSTADRGGTHTDVSFEKSLAELEEIVAQLEAGAKPLDESLGLYEEGVAAYRRCNSILEKARSRIRLVLAGASGEPVFREAESAKPQNQPKSTRRAAPEKKIEAPAAALPEDLREPADESEAAGEPDTESGEAAKNVKQYLDSDPSCPQNLNPHSRPNINPGKSKAGDSLFGSTQ